MGDEIEKVLPPGGEHKHGRDRPLYPLPPQKSHGKNKNHYAHPLQGVQFTLSQRSDIETEMQSVKVSLDSVITRLSGLDLDSLDYDFSLERTVLDRREYTVSLCFTRTSHLISENLVLED